MVTILTRLSGLVSTLIALSYTRHLLAAGWCMPGLLRLPLSRKLVCVYVSAPESNNNN